MASRSVQGSALTRAEELAHLDFCGDLSCDAYYDPEFPPLVCTLPVGHDGMHRQDGFGSRWFRAAVGGASSAGSDTGRTQ